MAILENQRQRLHDEFAFLEYVRCPSPGYPDADISHVELYGAVSAGMTNVVDMMFDNWPMAFQLTEGAKHAVQSPSGYYGFRVMRGFDDKNRIMKPIPSDAIYYTGHHVDHELVENIEVDCAARLRRMKNNEPRRLLITMGGAGAQRELFKAIIEH